MSSKGIQDATVQNAQNVQDEKRQNAQDATKTLPKASKALPKATLSKASLKASLSKASTETKVCPMELSKGKRKGLLCNRKILSDEEYCKFHLDKIPATESQVCKMILTKGDRKNKFCLREVEGGKGLCKIHAALDEKRPYNPYVDKEVPANIVKRNEETFLTSRIAEFEVNNLSCKNI
jgi:hypothetical protein